MLRVFRHYIPVAMLWLFLSEVIVFVLSVKAGVVLRDWWDSSISLQGGEIWGRAAVFAVVFLSAMTALGLYKRSFRDGLEGMLLRLLISMLLGLVVMSMLFYVFPELFLRRGAFFIAFVVALLGIVCVRLVFYQLVGVEFFNKRVLVLGARCGREKFQKLRRRSDRLGFVVVAFVKFPDESVNDSDEAIISLDVPLLEYVVREGVQEIVVALEEKACPGLLDDLLDCKMSGIEVVDMLTFIERHMGKIQVDMLTPDWLIYSDGFQRGVAQSAIKRVFDIVVSVFVLLISFPLMIVIAFAIKLEDGLSAPVFFSQVRVGKNWTLFKIIKFRSMTAQAGGGARWTDAEDGRITRVGKVIRRLRLDELPQVVNVLKGDMSFVGPRPEQAEIVKSLADIIPFYAERHRVKPGITGWAQLMYPYGASEEDALEKLQYDLYYIKNSSLFLDSLILLQTAEVVLSGKGVR